MNLSRRSSTTTAPSEEPVVSVAEANAEPAGKGRPTPKRADARKARRGTTPKNSKEAAALRRQRNRDQRKLARQALLTGDEANLPGRDAGPERRLSRDIVDSRFTCGQYLFGLIAVALILSLINVPTLRLVADIVALISITVMVADAQRNGRRAKVAVMAKFPASDVRGISSYAFMRAMLPRRFRRPPPKVERGDPVR